MCRHATRSILMMATLVVLIPVALTGCQQKEKVFDLEGPNGEIEVERDVDTGAVDVEVERK